MTVMYPNVFKVRELCIFALCFPTDLHLVYIVHVLEIGIGGPVVHNVL
jgi:hypothetical protein